MRLTQLQGLQKQAEAGDHEPRPSGRGRFESKPGMSLCGEEIVALVAIFLSFNAHNGHVRPGARSQL